MTIPELEEQLRRRDAKIKEQAARIKELEKESAELKKPLVEKAKSKEAKPPKQATNYSVDRHERKRRKTRRRKKSTGRRPKDVKRDLATQTVELYWCGAERKECVLRREQSVWRLIDGKAQYVHYRIFDEPQSTDLPPVDGVRNRRSEYGLEICRRYAEVLGDAAPSDDAKFVRLQNELVDNIQKLFVFVLHTEVEATNNRSERQARAQAMARKAARTSKTEKGAKRRGIIMSVLASLSKRLEHFTLGSVLAEINHWFETGRSVFGEELAKHQAATAAASRAAP